MRTTGCVGEARSCVASAPDQKSQKANQKWYIPAAWPAINAGEQLDCRRGTERSGRERASAEDRVRRLFRRRLQETALRHRVARAKPPPEVQRLCEAQFSAALQVQRHRAALCAVQRPVAPEDEDQRRGLPAAAGRRARHPGHAARGRAGCRRNSATQRKQEQGPPTQPAVRIPPETDCGPRPAGNELPVHGYRVANACSVRFVFSIFRSSWPR